MKRSHLTVTAAACLALAGCTDSISTTTASDQERSGDLVPVIRTLTDVDGPITPGWYFLPVSGRADGPYVTSGPSPLRAIVRIPPGYTTDDGFMITSGDAEGNQDVATLAVAGQISRVDTEPCGGGMLIDPGPTVKDLADALAPHATTAPRPFTVDGSDGFYLEVDPPDDPAKCPGGVDRLMNDPADKLPRTSHLWILNVEGHRVVVTVRTPGESTEGSDRMVKMAEDLMFVHQRAPH